MNRVDIGTMLAAIVTVLLIEFLSNGRLLRNFRLVLPEFHVRIPFFLPT